MNVPPVTTVETETARQQGTGRFYQRRPVLALLIVSVLLMLPILLWGFPRTSDDGETHIRWQYFYGAQMWAGDVFPRWIVELADGFGSPAFFIYPPLPHYIAAILTPLSGSIPWAQHRLAIAATFACFLSGVGCYYWFREVTRERNSALIGALVYLLAPYHLFVDTYFRGAYAELWALACAPFAFAGIHLLTTRRRTGLVLYALGAAALLMSHAPSALILLPIYVIYACTLAAVQRRTDILVWSAVANVAAVLIAGLYLGTALTQQKYIHTDELYTGYFDFYRWLIFEDNPVSKRVFVLSGVLQSILTILLGGSLVAMRGCRKEWRWLALGSVIGTIVIFFMMTSFSAPIWRHLQFIQKIQFPWRLLTAQTVLLALTATLFSSAVAPAWRARLARGKRGSGAPAGWPLVLLTLAMNAAMYLHAPPRYDIARTVRTIEATEYTLGDRIGGARYFPGQDKVVVQAGTGSVKVVRWAPRHIEFDVDAKTTTELLAKQFTYTGWTCRTDNAAGACRMLSDKTGDILHVEVPPGVQHIELDMPATRNERLGSLASIAGLVFIAICLVIVGGRRQAGPGATLPLAKAKPH